MLFGLVVGYVVAICMGMVDFSGLKGTSLIALPSLMPFRPEFNINAILAVVFLVAVILNLVLPKNMEAAPQATDRD